MPRLKQLSCCIQWAETDAPFQEFGTVYGDGLVESFIVVPNAPTGFCIRLTSQGYIHEGLAIVVFIDGNYQCNRSRVNLKPTKKGEPSKAAEVDFLLRQKEKSYGEGTYMGRAWRFDNHNIVPTPKTGFKDSHFDDLGTIEVLVLRCRAPNIEEADYDGSSSGEDSDIFDRDSEPSATIVVPTTAMTEPSVPVSKVPAIETAEEVGGLFGMMGLFDGASSPKPIHVDGTNGVRGRWLWQQDQSPTERDFNNVHATQEQTNESCRPKPNPHPNQPTPATNMPHYHARFSQPTSVKHVHFDRGSTQNLPLPAQYGYPPEPPGYLQNPQQRPSSAQRGRPQTSGPTHPSYATANIAYAPQHIPLDPRNLQHTVQQHPTYQWHAPVQRLQKTHGRAEKRTQHPRTPAGKEASKMGPQGAKAADGVYEPVDESRRQNDLRHSPMIGQTGGSFRYTQYSEPASNPCSQAKTAALSAQNLSGYAETAHGPMPYSSQQPFPVYHPQCPHSYHCYPQWQHGGYPVPPLHATGPPHPVDYRLGNYPPYNPWSYIVDPAHKVQRPSPANSTKISPKTRPEEGTSHAGTVTGDASQSTSEPYEGKDVSEKDNTQNVNAAHDAWFTGDDSNGNDQGHNWNQKTISNEPSQKDRSLHENDNGGTQNESSWTNNDGNQANNQDNRAQYDNNDTWGGKTAFDDNGGRADEQTVVTNDGGWSNDNNAQATTDTEAVPVQTPHNKNAEWLQRGSNDVIAVGDDNIRKSVEDSPTVFRDLYGPHGPYVSFRSMGQDEPKPDAEEEPRYDVPSLITDQRYSTKQVQPGPGYRYFKRSLTPEYIDDLDNPYARFVFKYRTKEQLAIETGIEVDIEPSSNAEVVNLQNLEKQVLIEMLMRAKTALGGKIPSPPTTPALSDEVLGPVVLDPPKRSFTRYTLPPQRPQSKAHRETSQTSQSGKRLTTIENAQASPGWAHRSLQPINAADRNANSRSASAENVQQQGTNDRQISNAQESTHNDQSKWKGSFDLSKDSEPPKPPTPPPKTSQDGWGNNEYNQRDATVKGDWNSGAEQGNANAGVW